MLSPLYLFNYIILQWFYGRLAKEIEHDLYPCTHCRYPNELRVAALEIHCQMCHDNYFPDAGTKEEVVVRWLWLSNVVPMTGWTNPYKRGTPSLTYILGLVAAITLLFTVITLVVK